MSSVERGLENILSFDTNVNGITIFDHVEHHQCELTTAESVSIQQVPVDRFRFPIDRGISILTSEISINHTMTVCVRNHAGMMIEELTNGDTQSLPTDEYTIELSSPIKLYIKFESNFKVSVTSEEVVLDFGGLKKVCIGARSHHERPSTTIKTTDNPRDLVQAISHFGSALKTTSCERSYPTLRGHPPDLNVDDKLVIPSILERPDTGITIEVPEYYQSIFILSPLVYYLGADMVLGENPRIKTREGFTHDLESTSREFEEEVKRVLKQCFFLDCITRTEGYYQIRLYERDRVESNLDLDFSSLYNKPLSEQIKLYLSVPYEEVSRLIPTWKKITYMEMSAKNIEILPYLINDLSVIYSSEKANIEYKSLELAESDQISRGKNNYEKLIRGASDLEKNMRLTTSSEKAKEYVEIPGSNALEHTWVGHGIPIGASKAMLNAFKNRLDQKPSSGNIDIAVVVNDEQMAKEGTIVDDVYSSRNQLALTTKLHHRLTVEELCEVFHKDYDFLHYIGHIDKEGFDCINGKVDATGLDDISIRTFLLNACASYQQAIGLVKSGAVAGIATTKPVLNSGAERVGKAIARLLNLGFPLISALKIAKSESIMGKNYVVIGDGSVNLTQAKGGIPSLCNIHSEDDGFNMVYQTFITRRKDLGTITIPYAKDNERYFLTSGKTGEFKMNKNELLRFISMGKMPIKVDSSLYWGDENEFIKRLE